MPATLPPDLHRTAAANAAWAAAPAASMTIKEPTSAKAGQMWGTGLTLEDE